MVRSSRIAFLVFCLVLLAMTMPLGAQNTRSTATYQRIRKSLDAVPAIDTHDHLAPLDLFPGSVQTARGRGVNLYSLLSNNCLSWTTHVEPWKDGESFANWWARAKGDLVAGHALSFYRTNLPAFRDLYGVDFERISDADARKLDDRIFNNYRDDRWINEVVTQRANIQFVFNDPYWGRFRLRTGYPFEVITLDVTTLVDGFNVAEFEKDDDSPYAFARKEGLPLNSLNDYLVVLDRLFMRASQAGALCAKSWIAYQRTLSFSNVSKEKAAPAFGKTRAQLSAPQIRDFEDFIMWRLVDLCTKYHMPFEIHTGYNSRGDLQWSNPMLLCELIDAHPTTNFILLHGGVPWVEASAVMAVPRFNVWLDIVWLPTLSMSLAKRTLHEWLEMIPTQRILWGADGHNVEEVYGATYMMRQCLAEVLAEKVDRGDLLEVDARRMGKQILRDNALALFPQLQNRK